MTNPVYKIETYTGAVLDYTLGPGQNDGYAANIYTKEVVTDGVGHFYFTVPTHTIGENYKYDDIAVNDTVKIWYGYDKITSATPDFVGKVTKIGATLGTGAFPGHLRVISGLSQGEVLLRRFKTNQYWLATAVSGAAGRIVNSIASDLSLGTADIATENSTVDYEVRTKTYFDVLRDIADYWINAGSQLKYDFYVDVDGDLVWKARPIRTVGVETLTVGDNIHYYNVTRDISSVKNDITVYGSAEKAKPEDKDEWTEPASDPPPGWTADVGTVNRTTAPTSTVGSASVYGEALVAADVSQFHYDITITNIRTINTIRLWTKFSSNVFDVGPYIRLRAPDSSNYFQADVANDLVWGFNDISMGPNNEYDAEDNPNGEWTLTGSPNWWDIESIEFYVDFTNNNNQYHVDGLHFFPERWSDNTSNAASITSYGQRDFEVIDEKLHSDAECQARSETLLFQLKDPVVQIEVATPGNTNILVGDRLSMTIPAENISAANYDVISVEHSLNGDLFATKTVMVNSANVREPVITDPTRALSLFRKQLRQLGQRYYKQIK